MQTQKLGIKEWLIELQKARKEQKEPTREEKIMAITILKQLGGRRFIAMTGAKNFVTLVGNQTGIGFMIPRTNGIKAVRVKLNALDLYDMEFLGNDFEVKEKMEGLYNDQLQDAFTQATGLMTHL